MNFQQYYDEALRTHVPRGFAFDMNHSILGLTTEIGEVATLVKRNVVYGKVWDDELREFAKEELGDILWYIPCGLQAIGYHNDHSWFENAWQVARGDTSSCIRGMVYRTGSLIAAANSFEYDNTCKSRMEAAYLDICGSVARLAELLLLGTMSDVMEANIAKLRKRYPEKFTPELAEARLDKGGASARES
jgi:NTP pyrophosphatase (non-canonical NTP hydrolase)